MSSTLRTSLLLFLTLLILPVAAHAHPGHGEGFLRADRAGHLLLHPWQLLALLAAGALCVALGRAPWMRWAGGAVAGAAVALLLVGAL